MKSSSNDARPNAVLNDSIIDMEPVSPQQVCDELEAELAREMDLLPPAVQSQDYATPPEGLPFAGVPLRDQLSREFQALSDDIRASVADIRATLMSMLRDEFHSVYQDVLKVSRELELPVSSAADLVADGEGGEGGGSRRSSFVQDKPPQPGTEAPPAHRPA